MVRADPEIVSEAMEKVPMTVEGFQKLEVELHRLKAEERPRIIQQISDAREHGDLSENAEYHAAKEAQGLNEARVAEIEDRSAAPRSSIRPTVGHHCQAAPP
jgi:transcription elongation GreA/GreB family factor